MKIRYSASTGAFYPYDIDYPSLPDDVQHVDGADYQKAMARAPGETFDFDASGALTIYPAPVESQADALARALSAVRAERAPMLDALTGIAGRATRAGDTATAQAADAAAVDLLNITKLPALLAATTYDDMKTAVLTEYRRIAGGAPAAVQSAFVEVLG